MRKSLKKIVACLLVTMMTLPLITMGVGAAPLQEDFSEKQQKEEALGSSQQEIALGVSVATFAFPTMVTISNGDIPTRKEAINNRYAQLRPMFFKGESPYEVSPRLNAPHAPGKLKAGFLNDGVNMTNFVRFLAGVPDDIVLDDTYNLEGQHGAVLLNAINGLNHRPGKPAHMTDEFYNIGFKSTSTSNLYQGKTTLDSAVRGYMDDPGYDNIENVGHRRWIINPAKAKTGFGIVASAPFYSAMESFDSSRTAPVDYEAICWPNGPAFPSDFFTKDIPWSITVNPTKYSKPIASEITVQLKQEATGKIWNLSEKDKNKAGSYFNVSTANYGAIDNAIIFRPSGIKEYNGKYTATISGVKDIAGNPVVLTYTVDFYKLPWYTINVNSNNDKWGYTSIEDGNFYRDGDTVKVTATPETNYKFVEWRNRVDNKSLSQSRVYTFKARKDLDLYAYFEIRKPSTGSGGSGGSGGGGGGGGTPSTNPVTATKVGGAIVAASSRKAVDSKTIQDQLATALSKAVTKITVSSKNNTTIDPATIQALSAQAIKANKTTIIYFDSTSGNMVQGRLYFEPTKLAQRTTEFKLGIFIDKANTSKTQATFEKFYKNKIAVVAIEQEGAFGARLEIAAKVDISKLNAKTLYFYAYNRTTKKFALIQNPQYSIDSAGFLHFHTAEGGDIVITDTPLAKK